jgi:hypothetical protein
MNIKKVITKLLLTFVIFSIGFATGKEFAGRKADQLPTVSSQSPIDNGVVVYFMHGDIRCRTCNLMEALSEEVVDEEFEDKPVSWLAVNFQQNSNLASLYDVASSTVVVSRIVDGEEIDYKRLDEVWTKIGNPEEFKEYIEESIHELLDGGK